MTLFTYNPCTKESQLFNKSQKLSQKQLGDISQRVRDKVNARTSFAPIGCCERCRKNRNGYWTLELAHIDSRGSISHQTTEFDLARLCGPSTDVKTCHGKAHTGEGKAWMYEFQNKLYELLEEAQ
jgi:hypothetical protein